MFTKLQYPESCEFMKCEHFVERRCLRQECRPSLGCDRGNKRLAYENGCIPVTNADFVRNMTDEEMAVWLCERLECDECPICRMPDRRSQDEKCNQHITCVEGNLVSWLREPKTEN